MPTVKNQNDPMTNLDMVQQYFDDLTVEKELVMLDLEKKRRLDRQESRADFGLV